MRNAPSLLPKWLTRASTLILVGMLMLPALLEAQQRGVISGTVTDRINKPLPGVQIAITSRDDKSLRRSTVTDAKGRYEIGELPPGTFVVTAELPGFRTAAKTQNLGSGRRAVWLLLEPGPLEESVTVPGPGPLGEILPLTGR